MSDRFSLNAGLHLHHFSLNGENTIEPRCGLKWYVSPKHTFGMAYGLNSRIEMIGFYLARQETEPVVNQPNKKMKMTKAHHFGLSYEIKLNEDARFKVEPYFLV